MKEVNLYEAIEIKAKLKIFLFINGDVSLLIHAKTLLETSEWLEKNHYIRSDAFTSGSLIMELTEEQYHNKVQVESGLRKKAIEISNQRFFISDDIIEKKSQMREVCITKKTGFETLIIRKSLIFIDKNVSILILADSFSDAATWLESEGFIEQKQASNNMNYVSKRLMFQLEDDPLDWCFLVSEDIGGCAEEYGEVPFQGLGGGISPPNWEQANIELKKLIND
ncbi:hypothetical protein [Brochothrix campestris]|uniref:Uncharacterized protein n=1 Tax=Brochothrix campestris FSL F6-1037 TaxID=1265861 RepID=W7C434_9LIST|nr:hypothetical protein [Brochothrix campestris]EUJ34199.1 hypothetical protein BCAMP_12608 [Brochothrix campestris FSL F6-1037]